MRVGIDGEHVVKTAIDEADRARLVREAAVLHAAAHPAVVRLLEVTDDRLVLERVEGPTLADLPQQSPEVVAGWGAALATTVADLHDIGYSHGAICEEHVVFDGSGRPLLCSFGRAVDATHSEWEASVGRDVAAVVRMVADRLPAVGNQRLRRALRRAASGHSTRDLSGWLGRPLTARAVARLLVEQVPGAR
ncbi:MAG: protein kinase family protein, partial [Acidimicrobiales bacterium]|nr:protein kinase family protein [Acidimicrobiales bacterium]